MDTGLKLRFSSALIDLKKAAQDLVEETNNIRASNDHIGLIRHLVDVRETERVAKEAQDVIEKLQDAISHVYVPDEFRRINLKTINVIGIGRVTVGYRWSCSMPDKQVGLQWLRDNGNEGMIIETVNSGTLAAFAKDTTETKGTELPSDVFTVSLNPYTSITKA